jgi:hypothetical protein
VTVTPPDERRIGVSERRLHSLQIDAPMQHDRRCGVKAFTVLATVLKLATIPLQGST